jgi:hypothetical protein
MDYSIKRYLVGVTFILIGFYSHSQDVVKTVILEGVNITSVADDFDTESFIEMVKSDSTFYLAFKALNYYPATFQSWLKVFKKGESEKGHVIRSAQRFRSDELMWVDIMQEEIKGKIKKKNGDYKYLTAESWDEVFFPTEKRPVNMSIAKDFDKNRKLSSAEKHRMEVKQMMFNPGLAVDGIPLIGRKMGIFEKDMHQYYTYSVYSAYYKDSIECLVFEAEVLPEYRKGKTVIKSLTTYFKEDSFEVMQREVTLRYFSLPIDFDIYIKVENQHEKGVLLPEKIYYKGFFDLPFMKKEVVEFMLYDFNYLF